MTPFLDIPVYRLPEADYYHQRKEFAENGLAPLRRGLGNQVSDPKNKPMIDRAHEHLNDVCGGIWRFNEIIGYIRLHFLGSQVRGEYYVAKNKKVVRTPNAPSDDA